MTQTLSGNKRIFISDIHMGDQRSMEYPTNFHSYCWLQKNIPKLTQFLSDKLQAKDVAEMIILGDLFDQWVIPTDLDPVAGLDSICKNPFNKGIIDNLKALAAAFKLSYVPGNHDMSACRKDISDTKEFINETFPGIKFICEDDRPTGTYRPEKLKLIAEHGNMYCLFNAPDTWTTSGSFLPLGYFISRLVAYKVRKTGNPENSLDILFKFIHELGVKPDLMDDFFLAVADDAGLNKIDKIKMTGITGYGAPVTIGQVGSKYKQLMRYWDENNVMIGSHVATMADAGYLLWPAYRLYLGPDTSPDIKIAIFGHTHTWKNEDPYPSLDETAEEGDPSSPPQPCKAIYANSGTWIDHKLCTYVETEVDEEAKLHYVRVKSYPRDQLLQELFVAL